MVPPGSHIAWGCGRQHWLGWGPGRFSILVRSLLWDPERLLCSSDLQNEQVMDWVSGCLWMRAVCPEAGKEGSLLSGPASSVKCAGARGLLRGRGRGCAGRGLQAWARGFCSFG